MAISMATPQQAHQLADTGNGVVQKDEAKSTQNPVSNLAEAIFTPFQGFRSIPLSSENPLSQGQKLASTIENVENQQALVKSNMVYLARKRAGEVIAKAKAELADLGEAGNSEEEIRGEERKRKRKEAESLMKFMRHPAKKDAKRGDFSGRGNTKIANKASHLEEYEDQAPKRHANGYIKMDTPQGTSRARSRYKIRTKAGSDIRSIVMDGTTQLEEYHKHSSSTLKSYKQAHSRALTTSDLPSAHVPSPLRAPSGNVTASPQRATTLAYLASPLKNGSPTPKQGIQRTSTGMPIVGSGFREPGRTLVPIQELARRGS